MAGIYVHVPFCHSKCAYCDFYSIANHKQMSHYVQAVAKEWDARKHELASEPIHTLYFGGGTPSMLDLNDFASLADLFPLKNITEFTIEANPEDISEYAIKQWIKAGVNRVSMGVQSLIDSELATIGRRHKAVDALEAISRLHNNGIENISCDLIYGLPGQTPASWQYSLEKLIDTGLSHLSAYCLSYERGTRLYSMLQRGIVTEADDETINKMYDALCSTASKAGFEHYEISNFALPGMHSRHNSSYWDYTPYLGLGPGAHSLGADGLRRYVPGNLNNYLAAPEDSAVIDEEDATDRFNDLLLISLRTARGLNLTEIPDIFKTELEKAAEEFLIKGLLICKGNTWRIPEAHWLISDSIIRALFIAR